MNEYQTTHNRQSSRGGAIDKQEWHIMDNDYTEAEQAIIRDSERIAAENEFIFGPGWLNEADHYYERRKGEREDELIRRDLERAAKADFERR